MHRSPIAAALYNYLKKDDSFAISCGTWVEKENRQGVKLGSYDALSNIIKELRNNYGCDISEHACTQATPHILEGAYQIIVIAEEEFIPDWLRKYSYTKWELPDKDEMSHDQIIEDIEGIKHMVETLVH